MEQPVEVIEIDTDFQAKGDGVSLPTTTKRARLALDTVIPDSEENEENLLPQPKRP
jgi:hypothetical protein